MAVSWRAFYGDGAEFNSRQHRVQDLPLDGALHFMVWQNGGRRILEGTDYYAVAGDTWIQAMPTDYPPGTPEAVAAGIKARYPGAIVIRGRTIPDAEYVAKRKLVYASRKP